MNIEKVSNHKFSLEISRELSKLSKLDNYHIIFALIQDWTIILLSIVISESYPYFYLISIVIIGSRQRALATILHESVHKIAAKNKKLNFIAGTFFSGYWIFQEFSSYKDSHVKLHHIYLGCRDIDPDFKFYLQSGLYDEGLNHKKFLFNHILSAIFLLKIPSYLKYLVKNRTASLKKNPQEFLSMTFCWLILLLSLTYNGMLPMVFLYWFVPYCSTFMVIGYFIELAEHYPLLGSVNKVIFQTRNRNSGLIESLFFSIHNENYHLTHHLRPDIPYWNIPIAHSIMMTDEIYSSVNNKFGGIFISSNKNLPLISELLSNFLKQKSYSGRV